MEGAPLERVVSPSRLQERFASHGLHEVWLLSDAEREYAARGRTSPGNYWFGDNEKDLCKYGNFWDEKRNKPAPCDDGYEYTRLPVITCSQGIQVCM
jgi:formylglycine-generating enzyme required for sulfatase activity